MTGRIKGELPLEWVDELPPLGGRRPRMPWALMAAALRERPGHWARCIGDVNPAAVTATAANHGLESATRSGHVYVRAPGPDEAE